MPEPYHSLLVHQNDMTPTLEAFHKDSAHIRALSRDQRDGNVVGTATHLGDKPRVNDLIGAIKIMLEAYSDGKIDRLYMLHNLYISAMNQKPEATQLLPASGVGQDDEDLQEHWDYIYEPDAVDLLDDVLMRYIESQVYRGAVENFASCR